MFDYFRYDRKVRDRVTIISELIFIFLRAGCIIVFLKNGMEITRTVRHTGNVGNCMNAK